MQSPAINCQCCPAPDHSNTKASKPTVYRISFPTVSHLSDPTRLLFIHLRLTCTSELQISGPGTVQEPTPSAAKTPASIPPTRLCPAEAVRVISSAARLGMSVSTHIYSYPEVGVALKLDIYFAPPSQVCYHFNFCPPFRALIVSLFFFLCMIGYDRRRAIHAAHESALTRCCISPL